ncbi:type II toxin-antitoxin system death-on-curing family toxin [Paludisphaera mucosa]|uniref:Type II toxin-antitoxin system death-on-curing family toxin n=1 Tax=Paludisphaera mucosa TaxID=3030827 RepID=A0ABT6FBG5_9BACT|nr:type II toxin-antitoxin system death-on-curing family toxin [Paludisphaera mucosa]MDG3004877.1 type II toxin-antitoxin system death-on-curing family toxin [Paludisphaera mucosa]
MNFVFLDVDDGIQLHADQVAAFGGSNGIRDRNLLASAAAQPSATFGGSYLHEDLFAMASAYLFHMVMNHPFVDGNKRAGLAAAVVFLDLNGVVLDASTTDRLYEITMAVAEGRMLKAKLAEALHGLACSPSLQG